MHCKRCTSMLLAAMMVFLVLAAGGCRSSSIRGQDEEERPSVPEAELERYKEYIDGYNLLSVAEREAALFAIRFAKEANIGLTFKASSVVLVDGWARVDIEQTGTSRDVAVAFDVYLKKHEGGEWEVERSGTGISSDQMPSAPEKIFR